jgi:hypothetical protein
VVVIATPRPPTPECDEQAIARWFAEDWPYYSNNWRRWFLYPCILSGCLARAGANA